MVILEVIHAASPDFLEGDVFNRYKTNAALAGSLVIHEVNSI